MSVELKKKKIIALKSCKVFHRSFSWKPHFKDEDAKDQRGQLVIQGHTATKGQK